MSNIRKNIASNISKYRKALNLSQQELADLVGVKSLTTVSSWERGANSPDIEVISKLCELFKISTDEMYGIIDSWDEKYNSNKKLENQVSLLEQIQDQYGKDTVELLQYYSQLNEQGKSKAISNICDLTEIKKYIETKNSSPDCNQ